jgi:hypothetical protein
MINLYCIAKEKIKLNVRTRGTIVAWGPMGCRPSVSHNQIRGDLCRFTCRWPYAHLQATADLPYSLSERGGSRCKVSEWNFRSLGRRPAPQNRLPKMRFQCAKNEKTSMLCFQLFRNSPIPSVHPIDNKNQTPCIAPIKNHARYSKSCSESSSSSTHLCRHQD